VKLGEIQTEADSTVYFSKWAIGVEIEMEWTELLSVVAGKITTSLQPS